MYESDFGTDQKPLFEINQPIKAKVYRSDFRPFEVTKYLDAYKIETAGEISIEVGTIEAAGHCATLVAQIENGMIIQFSLRRCANQPPRAEVDASKYENAMREIANRVRAMPKGMPALPVPLKIEDDIIRIPIGPIVIVIETDPEICIMIQIGESFCVFCFGYISCASFEIP